MSRSKIRAAGAPRDKRGLTGPRAVATGAVLYAAALVGWRVLGAQRVARGPQPSLTLPNQRWQRIAADRR